MHRSAALRRSSQLIFRSLSLAGLVGLSCVAHAQSELVIPVTRLGSVPRIDGDLSEWGKGGWVRVALAAALKKADRAKYGLEPNDDKNQTGSITVDLKAGVVGDRFYLALKYPDRAEDSQPRQWEWRDGKYIEGKQHEDMLALRFHLSGDFDRSMLSQKDYTVDVWLWSAAHTNPAGVAEDFTHQLSTKMIDSAAEYDSPNRRTIYIRKLRDSGNAPYKLLARPQRNTGEKLPATEIRPGSGSAADVAAKGRWTAGHWQLEFARALNTGHADDVVFKPGQKIRGQVAVFNQGRAEHKSVSEPLVFDFSAIK